MQVGWSLQAPLFFLTSLKRGRGILLTSTGLLSAMLTNLASRIATAQDTWTHLPKGKGISHLWATDFQDPEMPPH
jgi:hypothetical protein